MKSRIHIRAPTPTERPLSDTHLILGRMVAFHIKSWFKRCGCSGTGAVMKCDPYICNVIQWQWSKAVTRSAAMHDIQLLLQLYDLRGATLQLIDLRFKQDTIVTLLMPVRKGRMASTDHCSPRGQSLWGPPWRSDQCTDFATSVSLVGPQHHLQGFGWQTPSADWSGKQLNAFRGTWD